MDHFLDVRAGQFYRHHGGKYYTVVAVADHADDNAGPVIVYRRVGRRAEHPNWWHFWVEFDKAMPDGKKRFTRCDLNEVVANTDPVLLDGMYQIIRGTGPDALVTLGEKGEL